VITAALQLAWHECVTMPAMSYLVIAIAIGLAVLVFVMRARAKLGPLRAGDFMKVAIPRSLDGPLAMGTRLDIAAALKKRGTSPTELRPLLDGNHDQELLDRYWADPLDN
jgi:hypothetical protein